jgi:hypothetical protein
LIQTATVLHQELSRVPHSGVATLGDPDDEEHDTQREENRVAGTQSHPDDADKHEGMHDNVSWEIDLQLNK